MTWQQAVQAFLLRFDSPQTRKAYAGDLEQYHRFCGDVDPLSADRQLVERFLADQRSRRSAATAARRLAAVSSLYNYLVELEVLDHNPAEHVRRPRTSSEPDVTALDRDEARRFLVAADRCVPRDRALLHLLLRNGLRISEALTARAEDLAEVSLYSVLRVRRKGGKVGYVPLAPSTHRAIQAHLGERTSGEIFGASYGQARDLIARVTREAGVHKRITPHSLRRTFATLALDAGVPLHVLQDALGHASPATTQRYNLARNRLDRHPTWALEGYLSDPPSGGEAAEPGPAG